MKIFIMRHGDAVDMLDDAVRPLSEQGRGEARAAGVFLGAIREVPSQIWHSTLLRARETAEIVAGEIGCGVREVRDVLPGSDASSFARSVDALDDGTMIVTHLPFAGLLASALIDGGDIRFTTGTVCCLERRSGRGAWSV